MHTVNITLEYLERDSKVSANLAILRNWIQSRNIKWDVVIDLDIESDNMLYLKFENGDDAAAFKLTFGL